MLTLTENGMHFITAIQKDGRLRKEIIVIKEKI